MNRIKLFNKYKITNPSIYNNSINFIYFIY